MPDSEDILMRVIAKIGPIPAPVLGEAQSKIVHDDMLTLDFLENTFFEIYDFDLSMDLVDEDGSSGRAPGGGGPGLMAREPGEARPGRKQQRALTSGEGGSPLSRNEGKREGKFKKFFTTGYTSYDAEVKKFTVTKELDMSSPFLMECCSKSLSVPLISIVVRKAAGIPGQEVTYLGYFRIDLIDALIVGVDWGLNDSVGEEKLEIIFRHMLVVYRKQERDGSLGVPIPAEWGLLSKSQAMALKAAALG